jgi:hypothetical protein
MRDVGGRHQHPGSPRPPRSAARIPVSATEFIAPGWVRRYGLRAWEACPPVPGRGRYSAARSRSDCGADRSSDFPEPSSPRRPIGTRLGPDLRKWRGGAKKSRRRRARKEVGLQPLQRMARAGIEPATPRFQGTGWRGWARRKSLQIGWPAIVRSELHPCGYRGFHGG